VAEPKNVRHLPNIKEPFLVLPIAFVVACS
jgi:hypothetical protein